MDVIDTSEADSEEPDSIQENGNMEVQNQTENLPGNPTIQSPMSWKS